MLSNNTCQMHLQAIGFGAHATIHRRQKCGKDLSRNGEKNELK